MPTVMRIFIVVLSILAASERARASCEAIGVLSVVHDRYQTILTKEGDKRSRAAARLYPYLAEVDTRRVARDLADKADAERTERVLNSARKLSEHVISGVTMSFFGLVPHTNNVTWLGELVSASDCPAIPAKNRKKYGSPAAGKPESENRTPWTRVEAFAQDTPYLAEFTLIFIVAAGSILGLILMRSRRFRIQRVKRLPRYPVDFLLPLSYTDDQGTAQSLTVSAIDLSLGGMKLGWANAPAENTALSLQLPQGEVPASVIWSNAHYAGVIFDSNITDDDLTRIRRL